MAQRLAAGRKKDPRVGGITGAMRWGTGLGLFISRTITEAHGGRISAAGRPGGGTVFRVELPAAAAESRESDETAEAA